MLLLKLMAAPFRIIFFRVAVWVKRRKQVRNGASETQLRAFFQDSTNFVNCSILEIESVIGPWQEYDDWDLGRFLYEWIRPTLCVRVMFSSSVVQWVEFCHPKDRSRGKPREIIWERSTVK